MSSIVIHNNNIDSFLFEHDIRFDSNSDVDKYISDEIIEELLNNDFDRVFIKDNLSSNYLEFVGLRVAYHIRLSKELGEKRFIPIIILSDLDSHTLNKLDHMAKILFSKNVFIISNTKDEIEKYQSKELKNLTDDEYREKFLNLIDIEAAHDHHDITNEWAINKWSKALELTTDTIKINHDKISSMLYFKYLTTLHEISDHSEDKYELEASVKKGKVLYIDDEWAEGWSDIIGKIFTESKKITCKTFEYVYKDTNKFTMLKDIRQTIEEVYPDVVILDLRLSQTDHNQIEDIEQYTGIKVLEMIKEINPGIQVIMMTATRQSIILEKLYDYGILGYVKKDHPDDLSLNTIDNIDKLFKLVNKGLSQKYLKDIFVTKSKIEKILRIENDIFSKFNLDIEQYEDFWIQLQVESAAVFDVLSSSSSQNKLKYAMISIASSLEAILSIFIVEKRNEDNMYWDGEVCTDCLSLNTNLNELFYKKLGYETIDNYRYRVEDKYGSKLNMKKMIYKRNKYLHSREIVTMQVSEIVAWYEKLLKMIEIIENPPKSYMSEIKEHQ